MKQFIPHLLYTKFVKELSVRVHNLTFKWTFHAGSNRQMLKRVRLSRFGWQRRRARLRDGLLWHAVIAGE